LAESEAEILIQSLRNLAARGISIIFISHRLQEIIDLCDKIVVLRDGRIVYETRPENTDVFRIASMMVGRDVDAVSAKRPVGSETEAVLEVEKLWVDMPGETVRDATFSVKKGEIFGIGGLAGQGKLGIANGIMGLFTAGGKVSVKGKELRLNDPALSLSRDMSFVSEDRRGVGLLLEESIDWNIAFTAMQTRDKFVKKLLGGLIKWRDDAAMQAAAAEYIKLLDIKCTSHRQRAVELSGGNQQKVCLAKAFVVNPDILFVSEPTRGIDVGAKSLVLDTLRRVNEERGTTIIITSSELEELRSVCDRIAIIDSGRISGIRPATDPAAEFGLLMLGETGSDTGEARSDE
jgi:simple sugar transport system ATP-binding protein